MTRARLVPESPAHIGNLPVEAAINGLEMLKERRMKLRLVNAPSSLAKSRKTSGIDPVAEQKNYHDNYHLENVMMSRMKESFCDYDVPISHLRLFGMVKEGSVPKKTIENQFGDVDIDELEAVLTKRTLPYQEKQALEAEMNETEPPTQTNRTANSGSNLSGTLNSQQQTKVPKIDLQAQTLPSHPTLRRLEFIPSDIAVSGLPPPTTDTGNRTLRAPLTKAAASSGCDNMDQFMGRSLKNRDSQDVDQIVGLGNELDGTSRSMDNTSKGKSAQQSNMLSSDRLNKTDRSQKTNKTGAENDQITDSLNDTGLYVPSFTIDKYGNMASNASNGPIGTTKAGKAFTSRQRFDFSPQHVQRDFEATFLAQRASRQMSGDMMRAIYEGKGGYEFKEKKKNIDEQNKQKEQEQENKSDNQQDSLLNITNRSKQLDEIQEQPEGDSNEAQKQEKDENDEEKQKLHRPLDGFMTEVVPISQKKRRKIFVEEADSSFGLFLQLGASKKGLRSLQQPGVSSKHAHSGPGVQLMAIANQKGAVISPVDIAQDVQREEEQRLKRLRERRDAEIGVQGQEGSDDDDEDNEDNQIGGTQGEGEDQNQQNDEVSQNVSSKKKATKANADMTEDELDEPIMFFDGPCVIDYNVGQRRALKKSAPSAVGMLKAGGAGALMYKSPTYLDYIGPSTKRLIEEEAERKLTGDAQLGSGQNGSNQSASQQKGEQSAAKEDPLSDKHPHLKKSVNGLTFKEAPSQITQQLAQISEGMVGALQKRRKD
ncbi:MAG: hypothetical protein EZS28_003234 [Streblomastix strix]|uniref:Uncharacterized protein n=1 Tax=Streblomastix strix TaxID=222440 RepID=A0A5J4X1Y4_9EUKA|nr:MAG: hypothetical protein EZS28_003234 [Streblomastix strix]